MSLYANNKELGKELAKEGAASDVMSASRYLTSKLVFRNTPWDASLA